MNVETHRYTDTVGTWTTSMALPPPDLNGIVSGLWESGGPVQVGHIKLIPRGTVDLIFNLGADQAMYSQGDIHRRTVFRRAWISGLFDHPLFVGPDMRGAPVLNHLVAASIAPEAVLTLFGVPASELVNRVFDADLLLGLEVSSLRDRLGRADRPAARFEILIEYLRDLRARLSRPAPFAALRAARELRDHAGKRRIESLCADLGVSRRQLVRQFTAVTGLPPKAYGRLFRFRAIADHMDHRGAVDLADLAYRFGFSDQAHLSREFKAFSGETPTTYLRAVSADGEAILIEP